MNEAAKEDASGASQEERLGLQENRTYDRLNLWAVGGNALVSLVPMQMSFPYEGPLT